MKEISIALFIVFLFVGFEWTVAEYEKEEVQKERDAILKLAKSMDSVNTINIQNNKILMNRLEYYTKKSQQQHNN